jgi:hypothetical protein
VAAAIAGCLEEEEAAVAAFNVSGAHAKIQRQRTLPSRKLGARSDRGGAQHYYRVMNETAVDARTRLAAASMLLDRGWGRAKETHVMEGNERPTFKS